MKVYIEREELLKDIEEERPENWTDSESERQAENDFYKYRDIVKMQTTADVVEVVRCKDCKDYRQNPYSPEEDMMCMCWCDWLPTDPDDFCSYGVRR